MTVYEWITSKDGIAVNFNKYIDGDYTEFLEIKMDAKRIHFISDTNLTLTQFPITIKKLFINDLIPHNDDAMIFVLDQMYQDLINFSDSIH